MYCICYFFNGIYCLVMIVFILYLKMILKNINCNRHSILFLERRAGAGKEREQTSSNNFKEYYYLWKLYYTVVKKANTNNIKIFHPLSFYYCFIFFLPPVYLLLNCMHTLTIQNIISNVLQKKKKNIWIFLLVLVLYVKIMLSTIIVRQYIIILLNC